MDVRLGCPTTKAGRRSLTHPAARPSQVLYCTLSIYIYYCHCYYYYHSILNTPRASYTPTAASVPFTQPHAALTAD